MPVRGGSRSIFRLLLYFGREAHRRNSRHELQDNRVETLYDLRPTVPYPRTVRTCRRLDSSGTDTNFWTVCVTCTGECRDLSYDSNCIDSLVGFKVEDHIIEKIRFEGKAISLKFLHVSDDF